MTQHDSLRRGASGRPRRIEKHIGPVSCTIGLAVVMALYAIRQPLILSPFGLTSLANVSVPLALAAIGQTVVLLGGGLDLSIGAQITLVNCFAATTMHNGVVSITTIVLLSMTIGLVMGLLNGIVVAYGRVEPLIGTFCTSFVFGGAALIILPRPGGSIPASFATALTGNMGILPFSLILLVSAILLVWVPIFKSRLGGFIVAVGDNSESGRLSGLPVRRVELVSYMLSGLFASIAALFLAAETTSGDPTIGSIYTLNSLAAAVLGGVALTGGRGTVIGPVLGSFLLSIILNALGAFNVSSFWQSFIEGLILMVVLGLGGLRLLRSGSWLAVLRS
ncbi:MULTISPECIES: ABC transporter permease [Acidiphilium]|uniref:Autoinducer 2 import system permease protein LsrD n=1 Tax=Acidiphilium rubrum TaxID=526 RepID=A0A8G2FFG8_ACIRU|nr:MULTISPECIES: ABC transporter permease [Acidiphilium]SIR43223.1 monosaccharide ABC transporter membrane protein, CUT2 family [Acidiphilium rubrum]